MMNPTFYKSAISPGECIANAWNLVTRQFWLYVGMGIVTMLMVSCIPCVHYFLFGPVLGGFYFVVLRDMRSEPIDFGMLFKGFEKFVKLMVVGIIQFIPGIVAEGFRITANIADVLTQRRGGGPRGTDFLLQSNGLPAALAGVALIVIIAVAALMILFGLAWGITFFFVIPIAMETDLSVGETIKMSARAGWSNIGGIILLLILSVLIMLGGCLALCVGIFVAAPVIYAANAFAYRQVFPLLGGRPDTFQSPGGTYA
jgi:hypothetical protein